MKNVYADDWLQKLLSDFEFVLLLPSDDQQIQSAFTRKLGNRRGAVIQGAEARQLLSLYALYEFSDKIIIGSFDLPHGRKLRNLLDSGIATEEKLINDVILGAM
jgi:hypothetical protein